MVTEINNMSSYTAFQVRNGTSGTSGTSGTAGTSGAATILSSPSTTSITIPLTIPGSYTIGQAAEGGKIEIYNKHI